MPSRIWFLEGEKLGDNAQVLAILDALNLPWQAKRLYVKPEWRLGKPPFEVRLDHLDLVRSDPLEPPWPDLVITSGRRMAMAALWVKEQSGGRTKIAYVSELGTARELFVMDYDGYDPRQLTADGFLNLIVSRRTTYSRSCPTYRATS